MNKTSKILSLLTASLIAASLLSGCQREEVSTGELHDSYFQQDVWSDNSVGTGSPDSNPNTDTVEEDDLSVIIKGAVVVDTSSDITSGKRTFRCVGDPDNNGKIEPFTFSVDLDHVFDIEGHPADPYNTNFNYINIEFSGDIMDSYPCQLAGVSKVCDIGGEELSADEMEKYINLFNLNDEDSLETPVREIINNAVVVSAQHNQGSDRVIFECAAILPGYPGGYSPFSFSVPADAVECEHDVMPFDKMEGLIVNIEFSGVFRETYPMSAVDVTRVAYGDALAVPEVLDECKALFNSFLPESDEDCIREMYICDGYIINAVTADDHAFIYASARLGTCGLKDSCIFSVSLDKLLDENGNKIKPEDIQPGQELEFAYDGTSTGNDIFELKNVEYATVKATNAGISDDDYNSYMKQLARGKIIVYGGDTWGITMEACDVTPTGLTLIITQSEGNRTGETQTGSPYFIERLTDQGWERCEYSDNVDKETLAWTDEAWCISESPNGICRAEEKWEWLYGKLEPGSYRIGKEIMDFRRAGEWDSKTYYAYFEID